MKRFLVFAFITSLTFPGLFFAQFSYAQDVTAPPPAQDSMDKVPDEYVEEAGQFYDMCSADTVRSQYFNCECLSLAYLDRRIEVGPTESASSIELSINKKCRDAVGAAGPVYQACLRRAYRFEPGTDPEKFCECVANGYVETMNQVQPEIDSRRMVQYQTQAYATCRAEKRRR